MTKVTEPYVRTEMNEVEYIEMMGWNVETIKMISTEIEK